MTSYYSREELEALGLRELGADVRISRKASIYGAEKICLGSHVRVDDFCILSGDIHIGNYVHISAYTALFAGDAGIVLEDFTGISSRCAVYAITDDYSGQAMTNPTVPETYRNVIGGQVVLEKHALIGTGSTVLPGVRVGEGSSVGAMSLVNRSLESWGVYAGVPCRRLKDRSCQLLELEAQLLAQEEV